MSSPLTNVNRLVPGLAQQVGLKPSEKVSPDTRLEGSFTDLLSKLVNSVDDLHQESGQIQQAFLAGDPVELHQIMIKAEQAGLATDLLLEIRNRIVNAYNEMLRMPL